ncbi:MAG: SRPBCC family protein [Myxococcales bacterium]|nr:SRPBCC family protein [Myxococcales bacterium]MCB9753231.1 SRPBCC family protein [Myxococcales bacterium]
MGSPVSHPQAGATTDARPSVIETEHSIVIQREPKDILPLILDHERLEEWMDGLVESEATSAGPRVGSTYHQVLQIGGRLASLCGEVTEFRPPRRLAYRSRIGDMTITSRWELTPIDGGTRVRFVERSCMAGLMFSIMAPMIRLAIIRRHENAVARLKRIAESG